VADGRPFPEWNKGRERWRAGSLKASLAGVGSPTGVCDALEGVGVQLSVEISLARENAMTGPNVVVLNTGLWELVTFVACASGKITCRCTGFP